ncbi:MAG TPA: hypothetical protein DDZ51_18555 [Planctomycetaceae bacterium]|nr:hypothetical protein [Planctomycetaceae bacterium]
MESISTKLAKLSAMAAELRILPSELITADVTRYESHFLLQAKGFTRVVRVASINPKAIEVKFSQKGDLHCNFKLRGVRFTCVIAPDEAKGTPLEALFQSRYPAIAPTAAKRLAGPIRCLPAPLVES